MRCENFLAVFSFPNSIAIKKKKKKEIKKDERKKQFFFFITTLQKRYSVRLQKKKKR